MADPYAPPPMHHDRSGALVRFVIVAALLGAAAWGYVSFMRGDQTAGLSPPAIEEEQVALNEDYVLPPATPASEAPAAPAPVAPRRSAPAAEPPALDTPPPSTTITPAPADPPPAD